MRTAPRHFELHIPTKTILKVLLWALLAWLAVKLWPELVYLSLSLLLAVALRGLEWGSRSIFWPALFERGSTGSC